MAVSPNVLTAALGAIVLRKYHEPCTDFILLWTTAEINYVDYGQGEPVVLIHGWPLDLQS